MPATVTLSSTTLTAHVSARDVAVKVESTSGVLPGLRLVVEGESMRVVSLGLDSYVNVQRGMDGTVAREHDSGEAVYIAQAHQLYNADPVGAPLEAILVSPWINLQTGSVWFAQGDEQTTAKRWWQKQTVTYSQGPFGIRTVTYDPTSST